MSQTLTLVIAQRDQIQAAYIESESLRQQMAHYNIQNQHYQSMHVSPKNEALSNNTSSVLRERQDELGGAS